jgi:hypothetical protein
MSWRAFVIFSQHLDVVKVRATGAAIVGLARASRTEKEAVRNLGAMMRRR